MALKARAIRSLNHRVTWVGGCGSTALGSGTARRRFAWASARGASPKGAVVTTPSRRRKGKGAQRWRVCPIMSFSSSRPSDRLARSDHWRCMAPAPLAFARCDHRPNTRGEPECPEHGPNDGEGLRRGAPGLGRQGRIVRLLGPPDGTLHFPRGGQALRKLEVGRRVDIVELAPACPRIE